MQNIMLMMLQNFLSNPPRSGLDKKFVDTLLISKASRVVYVSCDPSSLARDLKMLKEGYEIESIQPVDMFPNTYHVETVVLLSHKSSEKHINCSCLNSISGNCLKMTNGNKS